MRSIPAMTFLAFSALLGAAACSSKPTTQQQPIVPVGNPPATTANCDDFASKLCGGLERCAPTLLGLVYGDETSCAQRETLSCTLSAQAPGMTSPAADVSACSAALNNATCDAFFTTLDACPVTPGTFKVGTACATDGQCASAHCSITSPGCGVCAATIPKGSSCSKDSTGCVAGTACDNNIICAARAQKGGSCANGELCETPLVCANNTCTDGGEAGAACGTGNPDCNSLTARCDTDTNKCVALGFAAAGQACGLLDSNTKVVYCGGLGACSVTKGATQGTCLSATADGDACNANTPGCSPPAQCVNAVCTVVNPSTCK